MYDNPTNRPSGICWEKCNAPQKEILRRIGQYSLEN